MTTRAELKVSRNGPERRK